MTNDHRDSDPDRRPLPDEQKHSFWWKLWQVAKVAQARLRFVAILAAVGALIASWDTLNNYYEKWTRPLYGEEETANSDLEYFCPMHPFIVRDTPKEKCPICHMDLARRKKGSANAEPLPAGTVSRVQLTPYRVVLAGVETREVSYLPLTKELKSFGTVEFDETRERRIAARQKGRVLKLFVNYTGQMVEKDEELATLDVRYSPELSVTLEDLLRAQKSGNKELEEMARKRLELWDIGDEQVSAFIRTGKVGTRLTIRSPIKGHVIKKYQKEGDFVDEGTLLYDVVDLSTVWIEVQVYEADQGLLRVGQAVSAMTLSLANEEFSGKLTFIYPHLDENTRTLTARFEMPNPGHRLRPGMYATVRIAVAPKDVMSSAEGEKPAADEAAVMLGRGLVLAVPENAVIDTGELKVVYREAAPNRFEGVPVKLGPRMTERGSTRTFYPVAGGLKAGDRVVTNGSFLIDAQTRLNPSAGSIYFGGSGGQTGSSSVSVRPSTPAAVSEEDERLIKAQKVCPVTGKPLGSMGVPFKVLIDNQPVFLCCDGCEDRALTDRAQTLRKVEALKNKTKEAGGSGAPEGNH